MATDGRSCSANHRTKNTNTVFLADKRCLPRRRHTTRGSKATCGTSFGNGAAATHLRRRRWRQRWQLMRTVGGERKHRWRFHHIWRRGTGVTYGVRERHPWCDAIRNAGRHPQRHEIASDVCRSHERSDSVRWGGEWELWLRTVSTGRSTVGSSDVHSARSTERCTVMRLPEISGRHDRGPVNVKHGCRQSRRLIVAEHRKSDRRRHRWQRWYAKNSVGSTKHRRGGLGVICSERLRRKARRDQSIRQRRKGAHKRSHRKCSTTRATNSGH